MKAIVERIQLSNDVTQFAGRRWETNKVMHVQSTKFVSCDTVEKLLGVEDNAMLMNESIGGNLFCFINIY